MYNSASAPPACYLQVRRSLRKISHSVHLNGPFNHKMIFETSPVMRGRRSTGAVPIRWIAPPVCCLYIFSNCSLFSQDFLPETETRFITLSQTLFHSGLSCRARTRISSSHPSTQRQHLPRVHFKHLEQDRSNGPFASEETEQAANKLKGPMRQ